MMTSEPNHVWDAIREHSTANSDEDYGHFVADWSLDYYCQRLRQVGLAGHRDVLDVGCGFGQWLVALATLNERACGVEIHQKRLETTNALIESLWLDNAEARQGSATSIPYADDSFDVVFCYGVFMFVDRAEALAEFRRVLRPGGLLFVSTNARGWWLQLAARNIRKNRAMSKVAWKAFRSGRTEGMPNATDLKDVLGLLDPRDWTGVCAAPEGLLWTDRSVKPVDKVVYEGGFFGYERVIDIEARCVKPGLSVTHLPSSGNSVERRTRAVLSKHHYDFESELRCYPAVDYETASYLNTKKSVVDYSIYQSKHFDRLETLRWMFDRITEGFRTEEAKALACITFVQKAFYHHFALQPMSGGETILDPLASLLFGACRCGSSARFLIDLLEAGGLQGRLLGGSCHTSAEVLCEERWILADASLFPPGIVPRRSDGAVASTEDIVADPGILDRTPSYVNLNTRHCDLIKELYPNTYAPIERYLRCTILPSVGYFGGEFSPETSGKLRRWRKKAPLSALQHDPDAGWRGSDLIEEPPSETPILPTKQRPEQVRSLSREGASLVWQPAHRTFEGETSYEVWLARTSRGWNYGAIPVGTEFLGQGQRFTTSGCRLDLPEEFREQPIYVTVYARSAVDAPEFVLPSEEFVI